MKDILLMLIQAHLNTPYKWGGNHPLEGMDCSGFVLELLRSVGLWGKSDTTAQGIADKFGTTPSGSPSFGDLVYFGSNTSSITHIGFALGDGLMVEAGGGGASTQSLEDAKRQGAYVRIRPIDTRKDYVGRSSMGIR